MVESVTQVLAKGSRKLVQSSSIGRKYIEDVLLALLSGDDDCSCLHGILIPIDRSWLRAVVWGVRSGGAGEDSIEK